MIISLDSIINLPQRECVNALFDLLENIPEKENIYATLLFEKYYQDMYENILDLCRIIMSRRGGLKTFYLFGNENNRGHNHSMLQNSPIFVDYFAIKTYAILQHYGQKFNRSWNYKANKTLFLTGKSNKHNRAGLMSKLYDAGLLDSLEWSFYANEGMIGDIKNSGWLNHYSIEEFDKFIRDCQRNPDNINIGLQPRSSHYGGFPYAVSLYEDTSLSCIPETDCGHTTKKPWITEKTWKAIANHHPFVLAAESSTIPMLRKMGFKTFENYMHYPDYYREKNIDTLLSKVVDNVKYFQRTKNDYIKEIERDVNHNVVQFNKYAQHYYGLIESLLNKLGETKHNTNDIIKTASFLDWI